MMRGDKGIEHPDAVADRSAHCEAVAEGDGLPFYKPSLFLVAVLHPDLPLIAHADQPDGRSRLALKSGSPKRRSQESPVKLKKKGIKEDEKEETPCPQDERREVQRSHDLSTKRIVVSPTVISSPSRSRSRRIGTPFRRVPLVVCRSSIHQLSSWYKSRAWRRETLPSRSCRSLSSARPTR